jgi:hypothetical protein
MNDFSTDLTKLCRRRSLLAKIVGLLDLLWNTQVVMDALAHKVVGYGRKKNEKMKGVSKTSVCSFSNDDEFVRLDG